MMKVGFIGAGRIARSVADALLATGHDVAFVLSRNPQKAKERFPQTKCISSIDELDTSDIKLVIEAASADAIQQHGQKVLERFDFAILSTTAISNPEIEKSLTETAQKHRTRLHLLTGGIVGLDGLQAVRSSLDHVEIETVKTPAAWGIEPHDGRKVLFDGSTREACAAFPRNVNVHASVAHASLGFDRCRSRLISDPSTPALTQNVRVAGPDFGWTIQLHSQSIGGVTGSLTPRSVVGNALRLLDAP
ncbi:putative Dinucleotide-utilizing enzyme [Cupriavidus taiwanensis]|uniref:aspartate dehydrogenase domain-containing protein n=1 Tax=Cupriavidus taiwanensis TaxID=164546 RepID=UPI000E11601B|nr:aspartate dehydrogenase domain-containing protein [Cupriavidus taiwanensis]SOY93334.1 putative Dinucleotide-utilizing enzyme [Cupriavidus taiwanensis]SOY96422.1 putative Dinucleotide-utilizing enzyme [Cupriavidus taiwanensis]